ncbi:MAG TPA: N-acetylmuramoyl-L-alanine amidase [Stellaceae bacterium]
MRSGRFDRRMLLRLLGGAAAGAAMGAAPEAFAQRRSKVAVKPHLVVLDPGQGGVEPGAIGRSGTYEKDVALATAREVARELEATRRYRVRLTRNDDEFIPLPGRVARARAVGGDLFLSIHADAAPDAATRGASVYTLSEQASDRQAAALAARENKADLIAGIDLSQHEPVVSEILIDLARRQTNNLSILLARQLVTELGHQVKLLTNSHRSAGFVVLKAPDIPSALVEVGCLSNRVEERLLQKPAYQRKVATGLVRSINDYFDSVAKA